MLINSSQKQPDNLGVIFQAKAYIGMYAFAWERRHMPGLSVLLKGKEI